MSDTTQRQRSSWRPILPVPEDAPPARFRHAVRGDPRRVFTYRDAEGNLLGHVCQFLRSAGGVHHLSRTWCENEQDRARAWKWIQFQKLRPLYRAEHLDPDRLQIALIVADEWCAEELAPRFDEQGVAKDLEHPFLTYDVVSWPGGRSKLGEVDWSALKGRICAIWLPHSAERFKVGKGDPQAGALLPKEKQPWRMAARALMQTLRHFGAISSFIVEAETTEELPDGWDPIQALNTGWDLPRLAAWVHEHMASRAEIDEARRLASGATQASGKGGAEWMATLMRKDGTGPLLPELHNAHQILANHESWKGVVSYDLFAHRIVKLKAPPYRGGVKGEWEDLDDSMATDWLQAHCQIAKLRSTLTAEAVHMAARANAKNPLVEYLRSCRKAWDKKPRLDRWLQTYLGAGVPEEDESQGDMERMDEYLRLVGRMWVRGAVARALSPGIKFDYVLILEGQQGLGKSSALSVLGGEWAMDTPFDLGNKEGWESLQGVWIVEIAELDSMNKADVRTAKTFFSRRKDRFRLPYARRSREFARTFVFGGTTNENEYFRDRTGNRRYLPVHVKRFYDRQALERDRDQLFGEAVAGFEAGEALFFSTDEEKLVRVEQRRRMRQDPWFGSIARWLSAPDRAMENEPITIRRILAQAVGMEIARADEHGHSTRVGHVLAELGYERKENKSIPERYHYVKRHGFKEGDE